MAASEAKAAAEAATASRLAKDKRLRGEFRGRLDTTCALLVDHFYGILKTSEVDARPACDNSGEDVFSEEERLRREGFHLRMHAERIGSAGNIWSIGGGSFAMKSCGVNKLASRQCMLLLSPQLPLHPFPLTTFARTQDPTYSTKSRTYGSILLSMRLQGTA